MLKVVHDADASNENGTAGRSLLDEIVRDGALAMLAAALAAEVAAYIDAYAGEVDQDGYRLVVRNGYHGEREVITAAGAVPVRPPRVNDKRVETDRVSGNGSPRRSCRRGLASRRKWRRCCRCCTCMGCPAVTSARRWSSSSDRRGLSAAMITRLTEQWQDDAAVFSKRSFMETDYVYVWVDGIHLKVRLEPDKVCLLVMIGVRADGRKELVALADGFGECSESWADLLRRLQRRGMRAPVLAVGDGALGFWKAVRDVFPDTQEQRCWWHGRSQCPCGAAEIGPSGAKKALAEVYNAENIDRQ